MEWYCRKDAKAIGGLKRLYFVEGREDDVDQKYFIQFTHLLLSIFVSYHMGVANRIEKLQRDFLWGGIKEEFKFHLVN